MCATTLATLIDRKLISSYEENWRDDITISTAVSHRAALHDTSIFFLLHSMLGYFFSATDEGGWRRCWQIGLSYVENLTPTFPINTRAIYHPLSWSWIIGSICDKLTRKSTTSTTRQANTQYCCKIYEYFRDHVSTPIGCCNDMFIGRVPKHVRHRTVRLECDTSWKQNLSYSQNIYGILESYIFCLLGNSNAWRNICLPSSNGVFTANSVAKVYGALANKGKVEGTQILSSKTLQTIFDMIQEEKYFLYDTSMKYGQPARLSNGFAPWALPSVHGAQQARRCLYHSGMGGFHAFADPTRKLGMCIFSNLYEPIAHLSENQPVPNFISDVTRIVREELDGYE